MPKFKVSDPEAKSARVYLNGKLVTTAIEADTDEGWVDVWNISKMAPLEITDITDESEPEPLQEVPVKRIFGKVEVFGSKK